MTLGVCRYVEVLQTVALKAAEYGLLVLLTCHRLSPEEWPGDGLWYSSKACIANEKSGALICHF